MIPRTPYRRKNPLVLPLAVILLASLISITAFRDLFGIRPLIFSAIYPFQAVGASIWKGIAGIPGGIAGLHSLSIENSKLKEEIKILKAKSLILEEQAGENQRLRQALIFKGKMQSAFNILPAGVIGRSPTTLFSILIINQGASAGVRAGQSVVAPEGLVGRIIEVSNYSSKVMLITNAESSVAAADSRSRDFGVVAGGAGNKLFMRYVSAGGDVQAGDKIVTSQISTIFPAGITIGEVVKAEKKGKDIFYRIEIRPSVNFGRLEQVFIIY